MSLRGDFVPSNCDILYKHLRNTLTYLLFTYLNKAVLVLYPHNPIYAVTKALL